MKKIFVCILITFIFFIIFNFKSNAFYLQLKVYDLNTLTFNYVINNNYYEVTYIIPGMIDFENDSVNQTLNYIYNSNTGLTWTYSKVPVENSYYIDNDKLIVFLNKANIDNYITIGLADNVTNAIKAFWHYSEISFYTKTTQTLNYNDGYNNGYNDGYNIGLTNGQSKGYTDGYSDGLTAGYTNGYNEAKTEFYDSRYDEGYIAGSTATSGQVNALISFVPSIVGTIWGVAYDFLNITVFGINLWSILIIFSGISLLVLIIKMLI